MEKQTSLFFTSFGAGHSDRRDEQTMNTHTKRAISWRYVCAVLILATHPVGRAEKTAHIKVSATVIPLWSKINPRIVRYSRAER